ncbi:MAG: amidase domain-containing protein [Clostridia bacterium]|nr:amidase domain-containing protein [Clostridia bacterium]
MREIPYNNTLAVAYARRWAMSRNELYYDFENIGGDCTNFASQCIYAGAQIMNFTPVMGWYYRSASDRTASWTGVEYLYNFLVNNRAVGPHGHLVPQRYAMVGDIVQFGNSGGDFYHTSVITATEPELLVAAHTFDALDRPLSSYDYDIARFIHIDSVRVW